MDLGITITSDLKWETQISKMCKKGNTMIYLIQKSFTNLSREMIVGLYKSYVTPKLEYAQSIWNPYYVKDIDQIEGVQRRITKLPMELGDLPYGMRLDQLDLTTLKERRTRGDLTETYKILNGHYDSGLQIYTLNSNVHLRDQLLRRNFLTNRVVYHWNRLSDITINSTSKNQFKNNLDQEMESWKNTFIHYSA